MTDTSGLYSDSSLLSASLQSSLENRLRARMGVYGSPEYALTWKHWDMESGPQIYALRASGRRTSDKDFTGWPTPQTFDAQGDGMPRAPRYKGTAPSEQGNTRNPESPGSYRADLKDIAGLAGWPTPNAIPEGRGGLQGNPEKALERKAQGHMLNLDDVATLAGWPTATTRDHKDGSSEGTAPVNALLGRQVWGLGVPSISLSAQTAKSEGYRLNPRFSLWLMGFPPEWESFAPQVMRSSRRSRQSS